MAFTKVVGPGIHTLAQLRTHNIHSAGIITATKFVGEMESGGGSSTFQNVTVSGNLTVQGDTTTLNTTLRNVELLRVSTASTLPAGIVTQTGTGDLIRLYDGATQKVTVDDEGKVGLGTDAPATNLHINAAVPIIRFTDSDTGQYSDILQSGNSLYLSGDRGASGSGGIILELKELMKKFASHQAEM